MSILSDSESNIRLLIMSKSSQNCYFLSNIIKSNVKKVIYSYETCSLDDILSFIIAELGGQKALSIAFLLHGTPKEMYLAGSGNVVLSCATLECDKNLKEFFICLSSTFMQIRKVGARIDFLNSPLKDESESIRLCEKLQKVVSCPVQISQDIYGSEIKGTSYPNRDNKIVSVMDLYFIPEKMEEFLNASLQSQMQNLSGYEKIRTVGKGAFGTAVLYRKKCDDSFVIVKEINMHDLTASERQLAMNEVSVLSLLNHENIVSYYDSFENDGILMIEMEYADGGNLAQYLSQMKSPMEEKEILLLFKQIVAAIKHMHDHNILHRDLKTANIFLTKDGTVKVGDFGISKMLTTKQGGALTVVGTPYYISPEICEGKFYNQKSDIWALGCILYEIACQQKTFEGSNLPALVNKIVKGQFAPVKGNYSPGFKQLIRELLQRDPDLRPTATEILHHKLPPLLDIYEDKSIAYYDDDAEISMDFNYQGQPAVGKKHFSNSLRSVLYDVTMHQADISLSPIPLPPRSKIKEVCLSSTHMIVLTSELLVYTWGDGRKGQLGHGKLETWRDKPFCVETLKGKNITRICAGEGFSVFSSDNGILMTCGNGAHGCLGHGDWNMCIKPKLIEKLLSVDVCDVSCGPYHVVVIGSAGEAFAWGCGSSGRLGTGREEDCCSPCEILLPNDVKVVRSYCGYDGTMFITERGSLYACGLNDSNKLGLNEQKGFLMQMKQFIAKTEVEKQTIPTKVAWLRQKVISVSMGAAHTAVLVEPCKLITFGGNKSGQLGRGNLKSHSAPAVVKSMADKTVTIVQCGDTFTIAATAENAVYFWGSRQVLVPSEKEQNLSSSSTKKFKSKSTDRKYSDGEISDTSVSEIIKIGVSNSPLMTEIERIGPDSPIIQVKTPDVPFSGSPTSSISSRKSASSHGEEDRDNFVDSCSGRRDVILHPKEILALYASPAQIAKGEMVSVANIYCFGMQVYLVVDTTAPLPRGLSKKSSSSANQENEVKKFSPPPAFSEPKVTLPDVPDEDSLGPIPDWLKMELANAVSSTTISKNITTTTMGCLPNDCKQNPPKVEPKIAKQDLQHIKVKTYTNESDKIENREMQHQSSDVNGNQNLNINREKQLENEILKLKEELKKYQKTSMNKNSEVDRLEFSDGYYDERPVSKKSFWSRRSSQTSSRRQRSRICTLQ
ncbi:LOW QUALITY PROTEIN: serine/threonine-protein kinase Nek8-like [Uloborus diversus]|uniref:LOW QUALITY PROTEIN: serine/threonine-protein kinase Nek8-like n=1 Tax=Uloborus diversus TaxID=327109 RepID=UPI0024097786|nr:LOW QUALITY PROTEIN: serine/threonine-protein kinase Nek8-like [Uloborus diversus]